MLKTRSNNDSDPFPTLMVNFINVYLNSIIDEKPTQPIGFSPKGMRVGGVSTRRGCPEGDERLRL